MNKVIITAAVTGSRPTKEMNPAVPYTPDEIARSAIECWGAGAAIAHIHVRDPKTGEPDHKVELFQEVVERIRGECDMLINLTTSGLHIEGAYEEVVEKRLGPVTLKPEICSLDIGSMNFQDKVFINPPGWGEEAAKRMREHGVKPEIEVFDSGHISQALDLIERGLIEEPPLFQLCMGVRWGIEATEENLLFMKSKLPPNARWSVLGIGRTQKEMIILGIQLGGNIRIGFEDNLYLREGVLAKSNTELVEMAVDLVRQQGRGVAATEEAREMLGVGE
ncbi:MAG: 3-keto-5-aminohexanoate cleavage protein [Anaerolineales bacterium]|nr:MAG: 3-keto-5-aminohexanoate cleavage protein [Anaerolineales bacterium]